MHLPSYSGEGNQLLVLELESVCITFFPVPRLPQLRLLEFDYQQNHLKRLVLVVSLIPPASSAYTAVGGGSSLSSS